MHGDGSLSKANDLSVQIISTLIVFNLTIHKITSNFTIYNS